MELTFDFNLFTFDWHYHFNLHKIENYSFRIQPYSVFVDQSNNNLESVFELIKSVAKTRNGYFSHGKTSKKLYDEYQKTNSELKVRFDYIMWTFHVECYVTL